MNPSPWTARAGVHVYRILQEALNNVARHSGTKQAWVRLRFLPRTLELEVQDHGSGFPDRISKRGIGLVAMRERSELMGGQIIVSRPAEGGTLVHLTVPREKAESYAKRRSQCLLVDDHSLVRRGFRRMLEDEPDMDVVGEAGDGEESGQARQASSTRRSSSWIALCPA